MDYFLKKKKKDELLLFVIYLLQWFSNYKISIYDWNLENKNLLEI